MFWYRRDPDALLGVGVAFTSAALDVGDLRERPGRDADLTRLADALGVRVAIVAQVHGDTVIRVEPAEPDGPLLDLTGTQADALWCTEPGLAVAVRVADCVPVCLATADATVVAAVHAGRPGLLNGVIGRTIQRLRQESDAPIRAWVGPHVCASCYEVPQRMAAEASAALGVPPATTSWGTPSLDLSAAAARQLADAGVTAEFIGGCTREESGLHSYRRDGTAAGRLIGAVWLGRAEGTVRSGARRVGPGGHPLSR